MDKNPVRTILWLTSKLFPRFTDCIYETMYFVQRGIYGYSERDCWDIGYHLDEKIPAMLRWLKEHKHGVPQEFLDKAIEKRGGTLGWEYGVNYDNDDIEEAARMYNAMLDVIIDGFEGQRKIKDDDWEFTTLEARQEKHYECRAAFERGMNLFVKYYDTLWD